MNGFPMKGINAEIVLNEEELKSKLFRVMATTIPTENIFIEHRKSRSNNLLKADAVKENMCKNIRRYQADIVGYINDIFIDESVDDQNGKDKLQIDLKLSMK